MAAVVASISSRTAAETRATSISLHCPHQAREHHLRVPHQFPSVEYLAGQHISSQYTLTHRHCAHLTMRKPSMTFNLNVAMYMLLLLPRCRVDEPSLGT